MKLMCSEAQMSCVGTTLVHAGLLNSVYDEAADKTEAEQACLLEFSCLSVLPVK